MSPTCITAAAATSKRYPDDTPENPAELLRNRGFASAHAGEYAEGLGHYARAVEAAPDKERWRYELAMAQWVVGNLHGHGATLQLSEFPLSAFPLPSPAVGSQWSAFCFPHFCFSDCPCPSVSIRG